MDLKEITERLKGVSDTPRLDARLLMADGGDLDAKIRRRLNHEPVSKIIGKKGFWKSEFITSPDVLDPRPDSETMIAAVLEHCPDKNRSYHILDIGVGSGCLLFSLLDEYPCATGVGIDISPQALQIATQNKQGRPATLIQKDFYQPNWTDDLEKFDIIISNPPYIPTGEIETLSPDVRLFDPLSALDGGPDGLDAYRALAKSLPTLLNKGSLIFLEIGQNQEQDVSQIFTSADFRLLKIVPDLGHINRILVLNKG
ncbi:MAG: peptide chain release factor N(5)-glutamine methyltransferase [Alphaproteobacteria bacterium]|nr:peptide chain release factor N(5)-glutamine methyltransferase [Alphaproteobacteria bacterium]